MGILNVTPDSFHDGGKYNSEQKQVKRVGQMLAEGADMIDIGGYSSRPGAEHVDASEELSRVIPCVTAIKREYPNTVLSIDTFRAEIARAAVAEGAGIVNTDDGPWPLLLLLAFKRQLPPLCSLTVASPDGIEVSDQLKLEKDVLRLLGSDLERVRPIAEALDLMPAKIDLNQSSPDSQNYYFW